MSDRGDLRQRLRNGTIRRRDFVTLTGSVGAGLALSSFLAACGGSSTTPNASGSGGAAATATSGGSGSGSSSTAITTSSPVAGAQITGEELVVALTPDPLQMSPWLPNSMPGYSIHYHLYEPTIFRDNQMNLIPVLAESWDQVKPDTLQLKLRKNVTYHNGQPFTAADVKFTYENITAADSKALWKPMLSAITGVETPDDNTVLLYTNGPNRTLLRELTVAAIMSQQIFNDIGGNWANKAIGTGPFTFVEYRPGDRVILERNDAYWGQKPALKRITFRIITEDGTRISSLKSGDVFMINNIPPDQVDGVNATSIAKVVSSPTARIVYCGMRVDRPVFKDARVRQAVNYAINRDEINQGLFKGLAAPATSPLAPMVFGADPTLGPWPFDPNKAKDLLKQAGLNKPKVAFGSANGRYINDKQVGQAVAEYMTNVGFDVQFEAPEWGQFYSEVYKYDKSKYDMFLLAWGTINMEPDYELRSQFYSKFALTTAYSSPQVDQLLDQAAATLDDTKAKDLYAQAQQLIWNDSPWVWLYFQPEIDGINKGLQGYVPRPDEYIRFQEASITKS